ncbi:hypothetical protein BDV93DRAFT_555677 [Ceratobasidium sp. AG-I]|nr:hypothetical protein BDV93DRAFT_555677 [Ceratobasidium sp. AG-I]
MLWVKNSDKLRAEVGGARPQDRTPIMDSLPAYSPEVLPLYNLTPTTSQNSSSRPGSSLSSLARARDHPNYRYASDRIVLDLGPRRWGTRLPVYGLDGVIDGLVTIQSFKHVEKIIVRLIGKISTCHVMNNIPMIYQTRTILHKSAEIWTSETTQPSTSMHEECKFPFSFSFVSETEAPPSVSLQLRRANVHVVYAVRVDLYCKGVYMHETLQTEVLYLPRTTSRYFKPFVPIPGSEKRPRISSGEWHTLSMQLDSGQSVASVSSQTVQLLLPHELCYPSGDTIPFLISASWANICEPDVRLVRISTAQTRTGVVRETGVVARGRMQEDGQERAGGPRRTMNGTIDTGEAGKEFSWGCGGGMASVSYEIRATMPADTPGSQWSTTQAIELTSYEWTGENASGLPALSSPFVTRVAIHLINMSV